MMKRTLLAALLALSGCCCAPTPAPAVPGTFAPVHIETSAHTLAALVRDTDPLAPVRIYVEGDGRAFYATGLPTDDPTPRGGLVRTLAFGDPNPNVVYLARPCQYVMTTRCRRADWTTGRFSEAAVVSTAEAVERLAAGREVVLIGYSGGALLSGLVIGRVKIRVRRWITVAGLLDHARWTRAAGLAPLTESLNLERLPEVEQVHFAGARDAVIPPELFEGVPNVVTVPGAGHDRGFGAVGRRIYELR